MRRQVRAQFTEAAIIDRTVRGRLSVDINKFE